MSDDGVEGDDRLIVREMSDREAILDAIAQGCPPELAAFRQRWSIRKARAAFAEPEFAELIEAAQSRSIDSVEEVLHTKALAGNMAAIQMVLYNRRAHAWRDVRRIEVRSETTVSIQAVETAKQAAIALLREHGATALQALPGPDVIIDADVIEDDDGED